MISYAQNYEDVILERCFKGTENGFYVDVGAWDPLEHSVTHHFYERGWHGINVEPNPEYFERLVRARPRDVNLQLALGERDQDSETFSILKGSGVSTLRQLPADYIENLRTRGFPLESAQVPLASLATVCREHVPAGTEIDFMKIDVEGWETQVLRGHDWERWRPKVLVVEAITPVDFDRASGGDIYVDTSSEWQSVVTDAGYLFGLNDGLNRFYVRAESEELLAHLTVGVNCLDLAESYTSWETRNQLAAAQAQISALAATVEDERRAAEAGRAEAQQLRAQVVALQARVDDLVGSTSWRVTKPLRTLGRVRRHEPQ